MDLLDVHLTRANAPEGNPRLRGMGGQSRKESGQEDQRAVNWMDTNLQCWKSARLLTDGQRGCSEMTDSPENVSKISTYCSGLPGKYYMKGECSVFRVISTLALQ